MASANEYPKDFWIYPVWESEKSVLGQPMFFNLPESNNLILNTRGEAFSNIRRVDFGQEFENGEAGPSIKPAERQRFVPSIGNSDRAVYFQPNI